MVYLLTAFRSRAHTLRFYDLLRSYKVNCRVVNTPKEAKVGCGISVKCGPEASGYVNLSLLTTGFPPFIGVFKVTEEGGKKNFLKIF